MEEGKSKISVWKEGVYLGTDVIETDFCKSFSFLPYGKLGRWRSFPVYWFLMYISFTFVN